MASALGSLPTLLNYMQNRSYQRDRLAQFDQQMALREAEFEERKRANEIREDQQAAATAEQVERNKISARQAAVGERNVAVTEAANTRDQTTFDQDQTTEGYTRMWARISGPLGDNLNRGRYGGATTNVDGLNSLYENNREDLNELVRLSPLFRAANDGVDNYDDVKVNRVTLPDGSFVFRAEVANANTAGPITEGGSVSNDAPVVDFSPQDMVKAVNQGLTATWNDGGSTSLAGRTRALGDAFLDVPPFRPEMEAAAGAALGGQAAELSQAGMPEGVDAMRGTALNLGEASYDDLATILRDNGMTDEEIEATFPRAQTEPQQVTTNESEDRTGLSNDLVKLLEARDRASDQPTVRPGQSGMARVSARRNAANNTPEVREQAIQDYAAGLEAEIATLEARSTNNPRAKSAFQAKIKAKNKDLEFLNPKAVTSTSDLGGIDPPNETITLENMRELVIEKGWKPTEDQANQTADLLKQAGVQSVADIPVKLRPREATMAMVTLAAMDDTLSMTQRVELVNKLVNFASSGDTGYGVEDYVGDVQQAQTNALSAGRLAQDIQAFNYRVLDDIDTFTAEQNAKVTAMTEKMYEEDANWNDPVITAGFSEMRANFEDLVDPTKKRAVGRALTEGLGVMLSKYANEKNSSWGELIPNLFRSDPSNQQYINDPMSRIRISPNGKTFGFADAVGNDGIEEGEIPIAVLLNVLGPEWTKYVSDLAKTRPAMDM